MLYSFQFLAVDNMVGCNLHNMCIMYNYQAKQIKLMLYHTWKNFEGGKFWRIWRTVGNLPKFSPPIFINARVFNRLSTDSPNFSSPKTLEPLIRQKFPPPKFSHVWYQPQKEAYKPPTSSKKTACFSFNVSQQKYNNTSKRRLSSSFTVIISS